MFDSASVQARLIGVRERIARAAGRAGRDPASIRLIAVSKTFSPDHVRAAADAGQVDFGENKVQEGLDKMARTADLSLRWHLIGHLQSNKVRKAAQFHALHSLDAVSLLEKLEEAAGSAKRPIEVLIQVDMAGEPTKHGARPEDVLPILTAARSCRSAQVAGLMLLPRAVDVPEKARPSFAALRAFRDRLVADGADPDLLSELSMGMSHDFEVAIEEGATSVRIGSAVFGPRAWA